MDTKFLEKRGVVIDMAMKKSVKRGVTMNTKIFENRGVDMETAWNRCPPNSGGKHKLAISCQLMILSLLERPWWLSARWGWCDRICDRIVFSKFWCKKPYWNFKKRKTGILIILFIIGVVVCNIFQDPKSIFINPYRQILEISSINL